MHRTNMRILWAASLLLTAYASAALAGPVYKKKETEIKVQQTERTAPPKAKATEKIGPTLTADQFIASIATKIANINQAIIDKMGKLISITPDTDPEKPDFIFRLDRKSTRLNSSHGYISYAVFC